MSQHLAQSLAQGRCPINTLLSETTQSIRKCLPRRGKGTDSRRLSSPVNSRERRIWLSYFIRTRYVVSLCLGFLICPMKIGLQTSSTSQSHGERQSHVSSCGGFQLAIPLLSYTSRASPPASSGTCGQDAGLFHPPLHPPSLRQRRPRTVRGQRGWQRPHHPDFWPWLLHQEPPPCSVHEGSWGHRQPPEMWQLQPLVLRATAPVTQAGQPW